MTSTLVTALALSAAWSLPTCLSSEATPGKETPVRVPADSGPAGAAVPKAAPSQPPAPPAIPSAGSPSHRPAGASARPANAFPASEVAAAYGTDPKAASAKYTAPLLVYGPVLAIGTGVDDLGWDVAIGDLKVGTASCAVNKKDPSWRPGVEVTIAPANPNVEWGTGAGGVPQITLACPGKITVTSGPSIPPAGAGAK